jgi:pimeloyl-ACP methyl ester carboxylesterase
MNDRPEPLVLLHGLGMSARVWDDVRPLLEEAHAIIAPTLLGHRGGREPARRPVRVSDLVDDVERLLDAHGLGRPHIAGNSLGGWVALELARRGRAGSVCALSPAGSWTAGTIEQTAGARRIRRLIALVRVGHRLPLMRSATLRRVALRDVATHGERLTAARADEAGGDLLACAIADDILTTHEELAPLDPQPCPITLAWSGDDAILPADVNGLVARTRFPGADWVILDGCGHVPMIDDPHLVARTILRTTRSAAGQSLRLRS